MWDLSSPTQIHLVSLQLEGIFLTTTPPGKSPVRYMRQCVSSVHSRSGHTGSKTQCFCCSVTQSCLTLCDPMDCSIPGFPVPHYLREFAQTLCPLSQWWYPTISSSVIPFSFCLQSFAASGSFPMRQLFASGGWSIGASALVLLVNIQGWFHLGLTDLISLWSKGILRVFSNTTDQKYQFFSARPYLWSKFLIHTWLLEKMIALTYGPLSKSNISAF